MGKRVMAVDDSATVRKVLQATLTAAGYEVVEAVDGADALEKLNGDSVDMLVTEDYRNVDIVFHPDHLSLFDSQKRNLKFLATTNDGAKYRIQFMNLDLHSCVNTTTKNHHLDASTSQLEWEMEWPVKLLDYARCMYSYEFPYVNSLCQSLLQSAIVAR